MTAKEVAKTKRKEYRELIAPHLNIDFASEVAEQYAKQEKIKLLEKILEQTGKEVKTIWIIMQELKTLKDNG